LGTSGGGGQGTCPNAPNLRYRSLQNKRSSCLEGTQTPGPLARFSFSAFQVSGAPPAPPCTKLRGGVPGTQSRYERLFCKSESTHSPSTLCPGWFGLVTSRRSGKANLDIAPRQQRRAQCTHARCQAPRARCGTAQVHAYGHAPGSQWCKRKPGHRIPALRQATATILMPLAASTARQWCSYQSRADVHRPPGGQRPSPPQPRAAIPGLVSPGPG
jgi:hypothetical protein